MRQCDKEKDILRIRERKERDKRNGKKTVRMMNIIIVNKIKIWVSNGIKGEGEKENETIFFKQDISNVSLKITRLLLWLKSTLLLKNKCNRTAIYMKS